MIGELLKDSERKMQNSLEHLHAELAKVRTGRASLTILDGVTVDYYGNPAPLNQVANLGVPDAQCITIQPWEPNMVGPIEKAIMASDLGLTPANDGKVIRLTIPPLTTERRQQMAKVVKKHGEECKIALRNVRREFNDKAKALEKEHSISEDELKKSHDEIQKLTDKEVAEVDKIVQAKEKDLMET